MIAETLQPLIKELPSNEKHRLLLWLQNEVEYNQPMAQPNTKLRDRLIKHIEKAKHRNS